ncbi:fibronectin type III domain-containing protein [Gabonibacter chumensis]|uniref:fibronectin type III domain-containing protein n=1 Tax=Gabonibacter chumensis TaxID=2972474 RepID=UPI0025735E0D|nr:fibronectin type III domain-containing protein [Gabonibacter chumensis]MCR9011113.1 fibronectin type III domain-containing protein [Gabonibacter chumensis]
MKKIRKNILKLFLFVCLGLTLTTIVFANSDFFITPDAPGEPQIDRIRVDGCDLSYEAPKYDGGAPITGYLIEYRNIFNWYWEKVGTTKGRTYTVRNKQEGDRGVFRVSAINEAGVGVPSRESSVVIFRNPYN